MIAFTFQFHEGSKDSVRSLKATNPKKRLLSEGGWHLRFMLSEDDFSPAYSFRTPADPFPTPIQEPSDPPENPDVPVREPDPEDPGEI